MTIISVIIPVYNVENYLAECLESVINQSCKDIEILCINDCSTDNSPEILKEYAGKDPRIKIINHEHNKGLGPARNTGLDNAGGEYVFFLDSDDCLMPDILKELYQKALDTKADIIFSKGQAFTESTDKEVLERVSGLNNYLDYVPQNKIKVNFENAGYMLNSVPAVAWGRLYSTDFLRRNSLYFINSNYAFEDEGFFIKLIFSFPLISMPDKIGIRYRIRANAITSQLSKKSNKKKLHFKAVVKEAIQYLKQNKKDYKQMLNCLRNSNSYHKFARKPYWFIFDTKFVKYDTVIRIFTLPVYNRSVTKKGKLVTRILWIPVWTEGRKHYLSSTLLKPFLKLPKNSNNIVYKTRNNNPLIAEKLEELGKFYFLPNSGNIGDCLIAASEFQYFEAKNFNYQVYRNTSPWLYQKPFNFVYGGGGIWVDLYRNSYKKLFDIFESPYLRKCIILPSSFYNCPDAIEKLDERFTVFCREEKSYKYCLSLNNRAKFYLADDMAVGADLGIFANDFYDRDSLQELKNQDLYKLFRIYKRIYKRASDMLASIGDYKVGYFLRNDDEAICTGHEIHGLDLSSLSCKQWNNAGLDFLVTKIFLSTIDKFDIVVTDRLHIAIAAVKLGKKVLALDNSYGKISAVYSYSLKHQFDNIKLVRFEDLPEEIEAAGNIETPKTISSQVPTDIRDFVINYGSIKSRYDYERKHI